MIGTSKAWFCGNDGSVYELTGQGGSWFPSYGKNFTYTGEYVIVPEGDSGDWKVKFLTSGTFTATDALLIDVFAVGGGGGGGVSYDMYEYAGTAGGQSSGFGITANGGNCCSIHSTSGSGTSSKEYVTAGSGGSGGGSGHCDGGSDGGDGGTYSYNGGRRFTYGGTGQGTTTREFGESTGDLYAGGGGGATNDSWTNGTYKGGEGGGGDGEHLDRSGTLITNLQNGTANTGGGGGAKGTSGNQNAFGGGGGGGYTTTQKSVYLEKDKSYEIVIGDGGTGCRNNSYYAGSGGSGILIIRNHRE